MADSTKKPQPGRRRTRTFATPDGVAGRTSLPGLATGFPYRRGRAGLSIRSPSPRRSAQATDRAPRPGRSAPRGPRSPTSREHVEAVVVVALVVLRLQLDPDTRFAWPQADELAALHPGPQGPHHPGADIPLPTRLDLMPVERGDAGLEDRLHPSHIHRGGAESRQIGRPDAGGAAQRIEQRPNDPRNVCLLRVETRARWGRCSRQGWERHHVA